MSEKMDQATFRSLYKTTLGMRCAPRDNQSNEQIFRAMLVAWAVEYGFTPDLNMLSHDDRVRFETWVPPKNESILDSIVPK